MNKKYEVLESYYDHNLFVVTIKMLMNAKAIKVYTLFEDDLNDSHVLQSKYEMNDFKKGSEYSFYFWTYNPDYYYKKIYPYEYDHEQSNLIRALSEEDYELYLEYHKNK
jgi:hypothetical protein